MDLSEVGLENLGIISVAGVDNQHIPPYDVTLLRAGKYEIVVRYW